MADRLDRSAWRPMHTRIAAALGVGWMLDAFEVQIIGSLIPSIAAEFSLSKGEQISVFVIWFVGIMIGAIGFGWLADRVGRRRLFVATLVTYSVAALLTAASPTFAVFMVFRFITALGVGGEYSAVTSAIAEFVPARTRGRTNALVMNFWALGGILAGLVSIFFISALLGPAGWRYALLFGGLAAGYALWARRYIPESPRWLASQGRHEEANAVITEITGLNADRATFPAAAASPSLGAGLAELWREHRGRLLFGMALDFSEAAGYYGLFTFMAVFVLVPDAVDVGATTVPYFFLVANVGALAGGLLVAWALERVGRKPTVTLSYLSAAASVLVLAAAATTGSAALTLATFTLAVFCATCGWVSAYPTFSELFPTHLRATGIGASVAVGRTGAIIGQIVLAELAVSFGLWSAFGLLAVFWLIGAAAGAVWWWRGIEARGLSLEQLAVA